MARNRVVELVIKAKDEASSKLKTLAGNLGISEAALVAVTAAAAAAGVAIVTAFNKAVRAATELVQASAEVGDEFDKMAARTDMSSESVSRWVFLTERAGGQATDFEAAVRRMARSMYDYTRGLSTATDAWDALGVKVTDGRGQLRDAEDVLLDLADAFSTVDSGVERMALAQDVLGRGGVKLMTVLQQGRPELERQLDLFRQLHGTMTTEYTDGAAAVIDAETDIRWAVQGLKAELTEPLQPVIAEVIDEIGVAVGDLGDWVSTHKAEMAQFAKDIGSVAHGIIAVTEAVVGFAGSGKAQLMLRVLETLNPATAAARAELDLLRLAFREAGDEAAKAAAPVQDWAGIMVDPEAEARRIERERQAAARAAEAAAKGWKDTVEKYTKDNPAPVLAKDWTDAFTLPLDEDPAADLLDLATLTHKSGALTPEEIAAIDAEWKRFLSDMAEAKAEQDALAGAVADVGYNFERLSSNSISAFLNGEQGAIKFGTALRTVVVDALSAVIAKLLTIKLLSGFSDILGLADGGKTPGATLHGAAGFRVPPVGSAGLDSVPARLMPGEEVLDRSLSYDLRRFLAAQTSASYVSPFALGAGNRGPVGVTLQVARPVGYLDVLDLGSAAVAAAKQVGEANF